MNYIRYLLVCLPAVLCGCVPNNMHVTYGLNPRYVDDDVRFRTTYYFRTFDYCWDADVKLKTIAAQAGETMDYRQIIPQTDALYRYRMTGMASAAFSRIRFESGTARAETIDPFGAQVSYSRSADGFYIRSPGEVKTEAEAEHSREKQFERIAAIRRLFANNKGELPDDIATLIKSSTEAYLSGSVLTPSDKANIETAIKKIGLDIEAVKQEIEGLRNKISVADAAAEKAKATAEKAKATAEKDKLETEEYKLEKRLAVLEAAREAGTGNELGPCGIGQKVRKGFQIMGPEGIRTFDQDERLLMAMTSSAEPLIATLQEYSGRILASKGDRSGQLLSLAQESARAEKARRAVSDARLAKAKGSEMLGNAAKVFGAGDAK